MALGNNIKKYRRDLGLTQEELAGILNVTGQAVSKWESGIDDVVQTVAGGRGQLPMGTRHHGSVYGKRADAGALPGILSGYIQIPDCCVSAQ